MPPPWSGPQSSLQHHSSLDPRWTLSGPPGIVDPPILVGPPGPADPPVVAGPPGIAGPLVLAGPPELVSRVSSTTIGSSIKSRESCCFNVLEVSPPFLFSAGRVFFDVSFHQNFNFLKKPMVVAVFVLHNTKRKE